MPLNIARKIPRKSTSSAAPSVGDSNAQAKSASATPHIRQPLQQTATESTTPFLARKPSDSSVYSTASKLDKKRSAWRGVPKILPSLLKSSREVSASTVSQDREASVSNEPAETTKHSPGLGSKIPVRGMTASPKASLLPESRRTPPLKGRDSNERTSTEFSDGSATKIDDAEAICDGLSPFQELAFVTQKLTEVTNECSALREHIHALEGTNNDKLRQSVEDTASRTKAELLRLHMSELDQHKETNHHLQGRNEELASRIMAIEGDKAELMRVHDEEMQSFQLKVKNLQCLIESLQQELKVKDEHMSEIGAENGGLREKVVHLEEDGRVLVEGGVEVQKKLLDDVNHYQTELENLQKTLAERNVQFTQLQSFKVETENMLVCVQTSVGEKDSVIRDLQHRLSSVEESNSSLKIQIQDYESRLTDADRVTQALRVELTTSSSTVQQLRAALDTVREDAQKSAKTIEEQATQLVRAQKQQIVLQESARVLENEKQTLEAEKAELVRNHIAQVEAERRAVHNLRRSMESSQRESTVKQERSLLLVSANEELRHEVDGLKEQLCRDGEEAQNVRKELEIVKTTLSSIEEKNSVAAQITKEKEKLLGEVTQLRCQLEGAQNQLDRYSAQAGGEDKLKNEMQKALETIKEQKGVIGRLQHSVSERSREDPKPILLPSLTRATPARPPTQRSRSSTVSGSESSKSGSSSPKPPVRTPPTRSRAPSSSPGTTAHSTPLLTLSASPSQFRDRVSPTGSTDSDSDEDDPPSGITQQNHADDQPSTDVKRSKPQMESGLVYKIGHAVFGSLWRRIWG